MMQQLARTTSAKYELISSHIPVIETQPDVVIQYPDSTDWGRVCLRVNNFRWGGLIAVPVHFPAVQKWRFMENVNTFLIQFVCLFGCLTAHQHKRSLGPTLGVDAV
jgi:hypothetical protein